MPSSHDHNIYFARGIARSEKGDHAGAQSDFTAAIDLGLRDPIVHLLRGASRSKLQDWAGAEADFTATLESMQDAGVYALRGTVRFKQKCYGRGLSDFANAAKQAKAAGKTVDEAAASIDLTQKYKGYTKDRYKAAIQAIYDELK